MEFKQSVILLHQKAAHTDCNENIIQDTIIMVLWNWIEDSWQDLHLCEHARVQLECRGTVFNENTLSVVYPGARCVSLLYNWLSCSFCSCWSSDTVVKKKSCGSRLMKLFCCFHRGISRRKPHSGLLIFSSSIPSQPSSDDLLSPRVCLSSDARVENTQVFFVKNTAQWVLLGLGL